MEPVTARALWQMRSVQQFGWSVLLWSGLVALFALVASLEPTGGYLAHRGDVARLVQGGPIRTAMLFTGIAHFIIAFWFQARSGAFAGARAKRNMAFAAGIGIALCLLFQWGGGGARYTASYFLLALFFVAHALRDESTFGKRFGDIPTRTLGPAVYAPLAAALGAVGLAFGYAFFFFIDPSDPGARLIHWLVDPAAVTGLSRWIWWAVPTAILLGAAVGLLAYARRAAGMPLLQMLWRYRALMFVFVGILAVCVAGWMAEGGFYAIVLLHVTTWWVFMTAELRKKGLSEGPRELGLGPWLRKTQAGFQTLHIGIAVLALVGAVVWIHGFGQADGNVLRGIASQEAFRYWTIMHICLSFVPRPA